MQSGIRKKMQSGFHAGHKTTKPCLGFKPWTGFFVYKKNAIKYKISGYKILMKIFIESAW